MKKAMFYVLSWTWGLPMTLFGAVVSAALVIAGKKPERYGLCTYFTVGKKNWGGLEMGAFFLVDPSRDESVMAHEHGHALQNCVFGPLMPFAVSIPSAVRYHFRNIFGSKKPYDGVWFERQATRWGAAFVASLAKSGEE